MPPEMIRALGIVKKACVLANVGFGKMEPDKADLIVRAADEVIGGKMGTSSPYAFGRPEAVRRRT
jgi:fumarate hydratase class II